MNVEVLISCMHQSDASIIERTNISSDVLVINQTDKDEISHFKYLDYYDARIISTTDRGLSKSRNIAISNSKGDICLICDDDEVLADNYAQVIEDAFLKYPQQDVIAFSLNHPRKTFPKKSLKINFLRALKISSWQIAFKRKSIIDNNIWFNINFGSGTNNGPGEENLFLFECLKKNLKILYVPDNIGSVSQTFSQWFEGFTPKYFKDRGKLTKALMGRFFAFFYAFYFSLAKHSRYKKEISFFKALKIMISEIFQ